MLVSRLKSRGQRLTSSSELPSHIPLKKRGFGLELAIGSSFPCVSLPLMLQVGPQQQQWELLLLGWMGLPSVACNPVPVHSQEYCISSILKASLRVHQCGEKGADRNTALVPRVTQPHIVLEALVTRSWLALFILALF